MISERERKIHRVAKRAAIVTVLVLGSPFFVPMTAAYWIIEGPEGFRDLLRELRQKAWS